MKTHLSIEGGGEGAGSAGADPGAVPAPDGGDGQPVVNPPVQPPARTVPLEHLVGERRKWQGREQSQQAEIQRLSAELAKHKTPAGPATEDDQRRQAGRKFYGLDAQEERIAKLEKELETAKAGAELGKQAHTQVQAANERAMKKAETICAKSFDKEIEAAGWNKDGWESFVASQLTDEDVYECFVNPNHMNEVITRCRKQVMPKLMQPKLAAAGPLARLPRTPGPGGTPPAPPADQPVKGKALHARAFERLSSRVNAEG